MNHASCGEAEGCALILTASNYYGPCQLAELSGNYLDQNPGPL